MKNLVVFWFALLLVCLTLSEDTLAKPKPDRSDLRVILIRHGEKPDKGSNLNCAGFNRSLKLPEILKAKFGIPDNIFVPSPSTGKQTQNVRMLQTIMPFAIKYNLPITTTFAVDQSDLLAKKIKKQVGTVLVVWEHKELTTIVNLLGVKVAPEKWKSDDFDSIYIITYHNNKATLTIDHEGITPAPGCAF